MSEMHLFTVKVREEKSKRETLFYALQVTKEGLDKNETHPENILGYIRATHPDGSVSSWPIRESVDWGDSSVIYVMNTNGATVATYYI